MENETMNNDVIVNETTTEVAGVANFTEADMAAASNQGKVAGFVTGCATTIGVDLLYRFAIRPIVKKAAKKFADWKSKRKEKKAAKKVEKAKTNNNVETKETVETTEE